MNIQGFQKLTLLDFPGKTACTVFTSGCNLRCPFCHNPSLVIDPPAESKYTEEEIFSFLKKRRGVLDGVAITGGEPLMQPDLIPFIEKAKGLGYAVKLDTNGTFPQRLKKLVGLGLADYVAMDVKNSPEGYPRTAGIGGLDISGIKESVGFLLEGRVDYEFRTTVVREFHGIFEIDALCKTIKGAKRYFLQAFADSGDLLGFGLSPVPKAEMEKMREIALKYVDSCELRGV